MDLSTASAGSVNPVNYSIEMTILQYPGMSEAWIVRPAKVKRFLTKNKAVWKKYNMDVQKFTQTRGVIKDTGLSECMIANMPWEFL